jgi:hypothetical protein
VYVENGNAVTFNSHALLLRSQILSVRSWLPETTLDGSPKNLAAITFPEWPVRVCCTNNKNENTLIGLQDRWFASSESYLHSTLH